MEELGIDSQNMEEDNGEFHIGHLTFTAGGSLKLHANDNNTEQPHRCLICETECMKPSHHSSENNKQNKLYECLVCRGKFSRKSSMKLHMKQHAIRKEYECNACSVKSTHYQYHRKVPKIHRTRSAKKHSCSICQAHFANIAELCAHEQSHGKENAYKCLFCGAKLLHESEIVAHLQFHTDDKPYECTICGVKFVLKSVLLLHLKIHENEDQFKCSELSRCTETIGNSEVFFDFFDHVQKDYKNPFAYMTLKKPERDTEEQRKHECGNCNAKFSSRDALVKHELEHRVLKHECGLCSEGFSSLERLHICKAKDVHVEIPLELEKLSLNS